MKKRINFKKFFGNFSIIFAVIAVILLLIYLIPKINFSGKTISLPDKSLNAGAGNVAAAITKENFAEYAEKQNLVKDLPKDSKILLKFYNFNSGERQWEDIYAIKKGEITKGSVENPDLIIFIHSKYIQQSSDICSAIKKANQNNDLSYEIFISDIKFLWKYKSILKYKNCF
jgi:hypothetical protein